MLPGPLHAALGGARIVNMLSGERRVASMMALLCLALVAACGMAPTSDAVSPAPILTQINLSMGSVTVVRQDFQAGEQQITAILPLPDNRYRAVAEKCPLSSKKDSGAISLGTEDLFSSAPRVLFGGRAYVCPQLIFREKDATKAFLLIPCGGPEDGGVRCRESEEATILNAYQEVANLSYDKTVRAGLRMGGEIQNESEKQKALQMIVRHLRLAKSIMSTMRYRDQDALWVKANEKEAVESVRARIERYLSELSQLERETTKSAP
jgi:hypothetical protein